MTDRYSIENQLELLQAKYIGTGNSDISRWEWGNNMKRDTLNSHIQNPSRLNLFGICELEMKILYGKKSFKIFKYTRSTGSTLESGDNKDTVIKSNNGIDGAQLQNLRSKVFFNYG